MPCAFADFLRKEGSLGNGNAGRRLAVQPSVSRPKRSRAPTRNRNPSIPAQGNRRPRRWGGYLTDNAPNLSASDGDLLLERADFAAQDLAYLMNVRIWEEAYMSALEESMGGIFDPGKIGEIKDDGVKTMFAEIADAVMTVVRYEETPVFGTDWKRLEEIGGAFSQEAAE